MDDKILSELLSQAIEAQSESARAQATLAHTIQTYHEHIHKHTIEVKDLLKSINGHFTNGFRSEIKSAIRQAGESDREQNDKVLAQVSDFTRKISSPKSWFSAFLFIASIFATIAGIVALIAKFVP